MDTHHLSYSSKNNFWQASSNKFFNSNDSVVKITISDYKITSSTLSIKRNVTIKTNLPWLISKVFGHETVSYDDDVNIDLDKQELVAHTFTPSGFENYGEMKETQRIYEPTDKTVNNVTCDVDMEFKLNGHETVAKTIESIYEEQRFNVIKSDMDTSNEIKTKDDFVNHFEKMVKAQNST
jgi:hypothetical protein